MRARVRPNGAVVIRGGCGGGRARGWAVVGAVGRGGFVRRFRGRVDAWSGVAGGYVVVCSVCAWVRIAPTVS
jgi:hypothetical protein